MDEPRRTTTAEQPATSAELKQAEATISWRSFAQSIVALTTLLGVFSGGYFHIISEARAQTDAGLSQLAPRIVELENRARRNEEYAAGLSRDVHEVQLDMRELYRVIQTGARSARLEAPPTTSTDGGQ